MRFFTLLALIILLVPGLITFAARIPRDGRREIETAGFLEARDEPTKTTTAAPTSDDGTAATTTGTASDDAGNSPTTSASNITESAASTTTTSLNATSTSTSE